MFPSHTRVFVLVGFLMLTLITRAETVFQAGDFESVSLSELPAWPLPLPRQLRTALGPEWSPDARTWGPRADWQQPDALPESGLLILVADPPAEVAAKLATPLRQFLSRGGGLLVTHRATRALAALGIDPRPNDEEQYSYSARDYAWGFSVAPDAAGHPLFAGLSPVSATRPHDFFIAQTAEAQSVVFSRYMNNRPAAGQVLATYCRREGREFMSYAQCTLIEWTVGEGRVLSIGIPLFPAGRSNPATEPNRQRFLANVMAYLNPKGLPVRLLAPAEDAKPPRLAACDELAAPTGGKADISVPAGARRFDGVPGVLHNEGLGVPGFSLRLPLQPGAYRMTVAYQETGVGMRVFLQVDGRDRGLFFVPSYDVGPPWATRKFSRDFVIQKSGEHTVGLEIEEGAGAVVLDALSIEKLPMPTARDWSRDETAGRPAIDAWGWYAPVSYQRPTEFGVDLAYMKRRVIDESCTWGSNMVELFHDHFFPFSSWYMPWDESDPKRPRSYRYVKNPHWGPEDFLGMARYCHERDMLLHWYHFTGGTQTTADKLALLAKAADDYGDALEMPPDDLMDGMGLETFVIPPQQVGETILPYNPGYYLYDLNRSTTEALSFFSPSTMCAHAWEPEGYDDAYPIVYPSGDGQEYYWRRYPNPANGQQRLGYQADCRIRRPPAGPFKDTWFFGGGCHPDWVVKQCFDFLRDAYLDPPTGMGSAVWWITEVEEITDDPMRRIVYAASMDPIRAALAFDLGTTGVGGFFDQTAAKHPDISTRRETIWRPRLDRPYTDHVLQNNYFRLYIPADGSPEVLDFDPTGTAHFDFNSMAVRISDRLIEDGKAGATPEITIQETGGVTAAIHSRRQDGEQRGYYTIADLPMFTIDLGGPDSHSWTLNLAAYESREPSPADHAVYCVDKDGVLPSLLVVGDLDVKEGRIVVTRPCQVAVALQAPPYLSRANLLEIVNATPSQTRDGENITVTATGAPRATLVNLTTQLDRPRWVQERGWWWYRGIQPSQQGSRAFVKAYTAPGDSVQIRPYGFLPEGVKFAWGSQYVLTFRDVKRSGETVTLTARVLRTTPWVFAPRLEFEKPIASVTLDGAPWFYFDGSYLMLPNVMGDYRLELKLGTAATPTLARTQGVPSAFKWENEILSLNIGNPGHIKQAASGEEHYALLRHPGRSVAGVTGARLVRKGKEGSILAGPPGNWAVAFKP
ncbi:hypothetical protein HS125_12475 [bacterium]|nr:hypothetical protein [bacterium]